MPKPAIHNGLCAEFDRVGAIRRALSGTIGHFAFDRCLRYSSRSSEAGAHWRYEHLTRDDYGARTTMARVTEVMELAMVTGSTELYSDAGIPAQGSGTTEIMPSADLS